MAQELIQPSGPMVRPTVHLQVRVVAADGRRYSWTGYYAHSMDAQIEAMERHPHAGRIDVRPVAVVRAFPQGGGHA